MIYMYECKCGAKNESDDKIKKCSFCGKNPKFKLMFGYRGFWDEHSENRNSNLKFVYKEGE